MAGRAGSDVIAVIVRSKQGDVPRDAVRQHALRLLRTAANIVRNRAIVLVSKPAKRIRKRRKRNTARGKKGSQYTVYQGSLPGQPPRVRRGHGRASIAIEYDDAALVARLGVRRNAAYMAWLELGTDRIAPRPWLQRALRECAPALRVLAR